MGWPRATQIVPVSPRTDVQSNRALADCYRNTDSLRSNCLKRAITLLFILLLAAWQTLVAAAGTRIAPTMAAAPQPIPSPTTSQTSALSKLANNTGLDLGTYKCTEIGAGHNFCSQVTDFSGMVYDGARHQMVIFGGGHASTNYDAINTFKMATLKWVEEYSPTPSNEIALSNYDAVRGAWLSGSDGGPYPRPAARHTVDLMQIVGDELILLSLVEGNGYSKQFAAAQGGYTSLELVSPAKICHYSFVTKQWTFTDVQGISDWSASEVDPVSSKIVMLGQVHLSIYDPVAKTRRDYINFSTYAGLAHLVDESGASMPNAGVLEINANLVYFPPKDRFYYFRYRNGEVYELRLDRTDPSHSMIVKLSTAGTPPPDGEVGYAYDSKNQIIGGAVVNNAFYAFDPATKTWSRAMIDGGTPGTMKFHAIGYDPVNNVFIFLAADRSGATRTWAYRYAR